MGKFILADNQELTRLALISLIKQDEDNTLYVATDRAGLVELLKEHEDATVLLDFTLFDFAHQFSIIFKDGPLSEVREALQTVSRHQRYISQRALEVIINQQQVEEERPSILTETETEIVRAIAQGKSTKEIAAERFSSVHTITTHRKNIFRKLGINTAHEVIKYALRAGLVDSSEFYI